MLIHHVINGAINVVHGWLLHKQHVNHGCKEHQNWVLQHQHRFQLVVQICQRPQVVCHKRHHVFRSIVSNLKVGRSFLDGGTDDGTVGWCDIPAEDEAVQWFLVCGPEVEHVDCSSQHQQDEGTGLLLEEFGHPRAKEVADGADFHIVRPLNRDGDGGEVGYRDPESGGSLNSDLAGDPSALREEKIFKP